MNVMSDEIVLVTGGKGLVGRNLEDVINKDQIKGKFIFLSSNDGNLENYQEAEAIFNKYKPKYVIHLAAKVGGLFRNMKENDSFFLSNMKINENILLLSLRHKVKKCISCLSTCIFPDETIYPITENDIHNGAPNSTNYGYSYAKRYADLISRYYNQIQNETLFTSIIPCNIYGKYDNFHLANGHVIPSLIHKAYIAKESNEPLIVFGSGTPLRQFIYAPDLAKLILLILYEYDEHTPIILSTDENNEVSIADVAELIRKSAEIPLPLEFDMKYADGQFKKTASNSKLRKLWPKFQFTPLSIGIKESVDWFFFNFNNARK